MAPCRLRNQTVGSAHGQKYVPYYVTLETGVVVVVLNLLMEYILQSVMVGKGRFVGLTWNK